MSSRAITMFLVMLLINMPVFGFFSARFEGLGGAGVALTSGEFLSEMLVNPASAALVQTGTQLQITAEYERAELDKGSDSRTITGSGSLIHPFSAFTFLTHAAITDESTDSAWSKAITGYHISVGAAYAMHEERVCLGGEITGWYQTVDESYAKDFGPDLYLKAGLLLKNTRGFNLGVTLRTESEDTDAHRHSGVPREWRLGTAFQNPESFTIGTEFILTDPSKTDEAAEDGWKELHLYSEYRTGKDAWIRCGAAYVWDGIWNNDETWNGFGLSLGISLTGFSHQCIDVFAGWERRVFDHHSVEAGQTYEFENDRFRFGIGWMLPL